MQGGGGAEEGGRERELVGEMQREEGIGCLPFEPSEREVDVGEAGVGVWLLANGAKVNQADSNGATALIISSLNGHQEVVKLLMAKGATAKAGKEAEVKQEEGELKKKAVRVWRVCQLCGDEAVRMKKCSVCRLVRYCSEACQLEDWKEHKSSCKMKKEKRKEGRKGGQGS